MLRFLFPALLPVLATAASSSLQFVPPTSLAATGVAANGVLPLAAGSVAVYGAQTTPACSASVASPDACHQIEPPLLAVLDASGNQTLALRVNANGDSTPLPLLYAGTAPGAIDGLSQINVELPAGVQNPTLSITTPFLYNTTLPAMSNLVTVYTR